MTNVIATSDATSIKEALQGSDDWRTLLNQLVAYLISTGEAFSSGECAAHMRIERPDLRFSVLTVGATLRENFHTGVMPCYDDGSGNAVFPMQVPRITEGKYPDRTPAGVEVFVYAFEQNDGEAHEFEVFIPFPGEDLSGGVPAPATTTTPAPAPPLTAAPAGTAPTAAPGTPAAQITPKGKVGPKAVTLSGKAASGPLHATVHTDGRLCIPRSALEAYSHATGLAMRGGDPVHVLVTEKAAMVALEGFVGDGGAKSGSYDIALTRGRVLFPSATSTPFTVGDKFPVTVTGAGLIVDLTAKV